MNEITKPLLGRIEEYVSGVPGWTPIDQLFSLYNLIISVSDLKGDILEIGSWCGRSSIVLGHAASQIKGTKVYCVDLFPAKDDWRENEDGSYSFKVSLDGKDFDGYHEQTVWKEPFERDIKPIYEKYDGVLDVFTEAVGRKGLNHLVIPIRGDSFVVDKKIKKDIKLAFLDGDHSYEAVKNDILNTEKYLVPKGWICFDDAHSHYEGVNQAIKEFIIDSGNYEFSHQLTRKLFVARKK